MRTLSLLLIMLVGCSTSEKNQRSTETTTNTDFPRPTLYIAAQNDFYTQQSKCGETVGQVVSISGHFFLQQGTLNSTFQEFLDATRGDVRDRLINKYLVAHPEVDPLTKGIIIIDIEAPHPKNLYKYSATDQDAIVRAFKVRIDATISVFPNAKIGLYGTLIADAEGNAEDPAYLASLGALQEAGQEGLFDKVDYLVPVLYPRFGCDMNGKCERGYKLMREYTQLGVKGSRKLRRTNLQELPLLPLLYFGIANGNSAFNNVLLLDLNVPDPIGETLGVQLQVLKEMGVGEVVLWKGKNMELIEDPNPNGRTVGDYTCLLNK